MSKRKTRIVVTGIVAFTGLVAACSAAFMAPQVSNQLVDIAQAKWPDANQASLEKGHDLFVGSCGRGGFCHKLPTPKSRTEAQWSPILQKMSRKANLDDAQRESVLRFILAVRDLPAPSPATN